MPLCSRAGWRYHARMLPAFLSPIYILAILTAVTVHEWAHAYAAKRLGDRTAEFAGRLTLNPLAHIDPLGALLFITVGFGWAKPVPVDPRYLAHPSRDNALIALAGPLSNLFLGFLAYIGLVAIFAASPHSSVELLSGGGDGPLAIRFASQFLHTSLFANLALMAFNFLPLPPLDGSKILEPFIPWDYRRHYEEFLQRGPLLLFLLIIGESFLPFPIISAWVHGIVTLVLNVFFRIAGGLFL